MDQGEDEVLSPFFVLVCWEVWYTSNSCPVMYLLVLCLGADSVPVACPGLLSPLGIFSLSQAGKVKVRC